MHRPPVAAVLRVSQLTISPLSSLWKVYLLCKLYTSFVLYRVVVTYYWRS